MSSRSLLLLALLVSMPAATGCAGKRIRAAWDERQAAPLELTRPARSPAEAGQQPYQLAFRISPQLMGEAVSGMLSGNMLEGMQLQGAGKDGGAAQAAPAGPRGRLGELMQRAREQLGGNAGLMEMLSPSLQATSVRVGFPADCTDCSKLELGLQGGLGSPALNVSLTGRVFIKARVQSAEAAGKPALTVRLEEVEGLHIDVPQVLPGPAQIQPRLEDAARDWLSQSLSSHQDKTSRTIPLDKQLEFAPGARIEGVGVRTAPSPGGELFIGLNTNLNAPGAVSFESRGPALTGADWSLVVGEDVVEQIAKSAVRSGRIPTRFDRRGQPDPEGKVALELNEVRFTAEGFQMGTRIWYFGWPAWWRDFTFVGTMEMRNGQLTPHITQVIPGEGDGATFMSRFVEHRVSSEKAVRGMGRSLPNEMPMPTAKGKSARLTPTSVQLRPGQLAVSGTFEVVDSPPQAQPAPPASR